MHSNERAEFIRDHLHDLMILAAPEEDLVFAAYCMSMAKLDIDQVIEKRNAENAKRPGFVPRIVK